MTLRQVFTVTRSPLVSLFVTDFDNTVSIGDTLHCIVHLAADSLTSSSSRRRRLAKWTSLTEWYSEEYSALFERSLPCAETVTHPYSNATLSKSKPNSNPGPTPHLELELPSTMLDSNQVSTSGLHLREFLINFTQLENASLRKVQEENILAGLCSKQLRQAGSLVPVHPGCEQVLRSLHEKHIRTRVLSVNWSRAFVEGAVHRMTPAIAVEANDLSVDPSSGLTSGVIESHIHLASDKEEKLRELMRNDYAVKPEGQVTVYCGGGLIEVLYLFLQADVGIAFSPGSEFMRVCKAFDIETKPLAQARDDAAGLRKGVYTTTSWEEIGWVLNLLPTDS